MRIPAHRDLPRRHSGITTAVTIGGEPFCLIANERADGSLGEVFIRHGVPLAELLRPGLGTSFVPSGHTDDPEIPRAPSVVDYLSRRLAIDWLPDEHDPHSHEGAEGGSVR